MQLGLGVTASTLKLMLNTLKEFSLIIALYWFVSSIVNRSDFSVLLGSSPNRSEERRVGKECSGASTKTREMDFGVGHV